MKSCRWEYSLNAIHYCLWLGFCKHGNNTRTLIKTLFSPIPNYLFTPKYKNEYYKRLPGEQKKVNVFFNNKETGLYISMANHWFGYLYSCYPGAFSFIIIGIADKTFETLNTAMFVVFFGTPIILCYIPAYKAVFSKDKYLKYFKEFEKEDKNWHRKWKWITILFCVGSIIMTLIGIKAMDIAWHLL